MSLLRTSTSALRLSASRATVAAPSMMAVRGYADKPDPEFSSAHTSASAKGFEKKEQVRVFSLLPLAQCQTDTGFSS